MCVYVACYNSASDAVALGYAAALKCYGYGLESWLAAHLEQVAHYVYARGSVQCGV